MANPTSMTTRRDGAGIVAGQRHGSTTARMPPRWRRRGQLVTRWDCQHADTGKPQQAGMTHVFRATGSRHAGTSTRGHRGAVSNRIRASDRTSRGSVPWPSSCSWCAMRGSPPSRRVHRRRRLLRALRLPGHLTAAATSPSHGSLALGALLRASLAADAPRVAFLVVTLVVAASDLLARRLARAQDARRPPLYVANLQFAIEATDYFAAERQLAGAALLVARGRGAVLPVLAGLLFLARHRARPRPAAGIEGPAP